MAQADGVVANGTGAAVRADLNGQLAALFTNHSGSSEPSTTYAYQWWADTNANVLKIRNSANNAWITLRELDGTMLIEDGSASTPGLAFADDTNTGIFSGAADQVGFATGGAERLKLGNGEAVFNDISADTDFRVESNGSTHMLFVDAGNNRLGINENAPDNILHINNAGDSIVRIENTGNGNASGIFFVRENSSGTSKGAANIHVVSDTSRTGAELIFGCGANTSATGGERFRLDSSGRLLVGTSSSRSVGGNITGKLQIEGTGTGGNTTACTVTQNSNDATGGRFMLAKSRGTSNGSITLVQSGDQLGTIDFAGADGTNAGSSAVRVTASVDGTPGEDDMPGRLSISTAGDGASSPTERVRIDSNGGINLYGNSSSLWTLAAASDSSSYSQIDGHFATSNRTLFINSNTSNNAFVVWNRNSGSSGKGFGLDGQVFKVVQGASEQFRVDSAGRVGVGTATLAAKFEVHGTANTQQPVIINDTNNTNGSTHRIGFRTGGTEVGKITATRTAVNYESNSDYRLKENIVDIADGITRVKQLQPRRFNFIANADLTVDGFLAHEAQTVVPEAVTGTHNEVDDDGNPVYQGIDTSKLVPLLTAALQGAIVKIEALEAKVAALEAG